MATMFLYNMVVPISSLLNSRYSILLLFVVLVSTVHVSADPSNFNIVNGQILTPGLAIIDAPQPFTPEGGDTLQVAIDISDDGRIPQPPYPPNVDTGILNITIFLYSFSTGLNLTISNGTTVGWRKGASEAPEFHCNLTTNQGFQNAGCQEIMAQESGSTVKHVNWVWPNCFVGNGGADDGSCGQGGSLQDCLDGTARGPYNISIHQSFRVNGTGYYNIFDLPIQVTNTISNTTEYSASHSRPRCDLRNNPLNETMQASMTMTTPTTTKASTKASITASMTASTTASTTLSLTSQPQNTGVNFTVSGEVNGGTRLFDRAATGFHEYLVAAAFVSTSLFI